MHAPSDYRNKSRSTYRQSCTALSVFFHCLCGNLEFLEQSDCPSLTRYISTVSKCLKNFLGFLAVTTFFLSVLKCVYMPDPSHNSCLGLDDQISCDNDIRNNALKLCNLYKCCLEMNLFICLFAMHCNSALLMRGNAAEN